MGLPVIEKSADGEIEWLDDDTKARPRGPRSTPNRAGLILLGFLGVAALVSGAFARFGTTRGDSAQPLVAPATPTVVLAPSPIPRPAGLGVGDVAFSELPALTMIASGPNGAAVLLSTAHGGVVDPVSLAGFHSFSVDASGTWLAAVADGSKGRDINSLWVGPVNGSLEPLVSSVQSFAWHEADAKRIAVLSTRMGSPVLATFDIPLPRAESVALHAPPPDVEIVDLWGDWGFVVRTDEASTEFDVLDASGRVLAGNQRGRLGGIVQSSRVLFSPLDPLGHPLMINLDTAVAYPVRALLDVQHVSRLAEGGRNGLVAVQASDAATNTHVLRIVAGTEVVAEVASSPGSHPMRWSADGSQLYALLPHLRLGLTVTVFDVDDNQVTVFPLADLDPTTHTAQILAVG